MYEFEHHGIKGQKWGVRRYQNEDGTLTEEGRKKYGSEDAYRAQQLKKMDPSRMSNAELRELSERMALEKSVKRGDDEVNKILAQNGMEILKTAAVVAAVAIGSKYVVDHLPDIASAVAKNANNATSAVTKAVTDTASNAVKSVADKAVETTHEVRKAVSNTNAAKAYVQTIDNARAAVTNAVENTREARKNIASTNAARTYVQTIDTLLGKRRRRRPNSK